MSNSLGGINQPLGLKEMAQNHAGSEHGIDSHQVCKHIAKPDLDWSAQLTTMDYSVRFVSYRRRSKRISDAQFLARGKDHAAPWVSGDRHTGTAQTLKGKPQMLRH